MPELTLTGVSCAHGAARPLFEDVSLRLEPGFTALVGENGAGKTTLLEVLAGLRAPTTGERRLRPANARSALCTQTTEFLGDDVRDLAARSDGEARRLTGRFGLRHAPIERWPTLSPGERTRWQIAAALARAPEVLLLDEPTNHLDGEGRDTLSDALRDYAGIAVIVSHDRALLDAVCTRTLRLAQGRLTSYPGGYTAACALWEAAQATARERRDEAARRMRTAERRLADARRTRAEAEQARSGRALSPRDHDARSAGNKTRRGWAEDRLGAEVSRSRQAAERAAAALPALAMAPELGRSVFLGYVPPPRRVLLSLDAAMVTPDGVDRPGPVVLRDVHLALSRGAHVRLAGPNGTGKSTLLRALLATSTEADAEVGRIFVLPQETGPDAAADLIGRLRRAPPDVRGRVLSLVASLGTDPVRLLATARPSPGEVRKLRIALALGRHVWALVLDEPTNHLDLPSIDRLGAALAAFPGALLLVTHDDAFAAACTGHTWVIEDRRVVDRG